MKTENWMKWDIASKLNPATTVFLNDHGCEGYGFFVQMTEYLYLAEGNKIPCTAMQTYAQACRCDAEHAERYRNALLALGLWKTDGEHFWSDRVIEEVRERQARKEAAIDAKKKAASARWAKSLDAKRDKRSRRMQKDAEPCRPMQNDVEGELELEGELDKKREEEEKETPPLGAYPIEVEANAKNLPAKKTPPGWREGCEPGGEFGNVFMTPAEFDKLAAQFGQARVVTKIADLDAEIENGTKKYRAYKNHYATIAKWCRMDAVRSRAGPPRIIGASTAATLENNLEFLKRNSKDPENESREIAAIIDGMFGAEKVVDCERSDGVVVAPSAARRS